MNRQQKKVRRIQTALWAAVIAVQLCTLTKMKVAAAGLEPEEPAQTESRQSEPEEPGQTESGQSDAGGSVVLQPDFLAGGSFLQEDGSLMVKFPAVLEPELLTEPETDREGPDGQVWRLARWETVPVQFPGHQEEIRRTEEYEQVEDEAGIPGQMEITAEWEGQSVTVVCGKQEQRRTGEAWVDGFRLPVTFHGYHADYYELGNLKIPHNEDKPQLEGQEAVLLEMAGLSPSTRRIQSIVWDGPAYTADDGEVRRDALATGQSLIADYQVTYGGTAVFPERPGWQNVAVYEPVEVTVTVAETTSPAVPEAIIQDTPVPLWQRITQTLLVSVGIGSILAFAALAILGIFYLVKGRKV